MERQEETEMLRLSLIDVVCTGPKILDENQKSDNKEDDDFPFLQPHDFLCHPSNPQSLERDDLVNSLRNETKLLKGRLKGYETLASLYKESKLLNSQLQRQCEEQRILLAQQQMQLLSTENDIAPNDLSMNSETVSEKREGHPNSFEMIDAPVSDNNKVTSPVEILRPLRNKWNENATLEEYEKNEEADDVATKTTPKDAVKLPEISSTDKRSSYEGHCLIEDGGRCLIEDGGHRLIEDGCHRLKQSELNSELFEVVELSAFQRHLEDSRASPESKRFLMELLTVGMKVISLDKQTSKEENHDEVAQLGASEFRQQISSRLKVKTSSIQVFTEEGSNQTKNVASNPGVDVERKLPPQAESLPKRMTSDDANYFMNKMGILQAQAMTFQDDFEQERRDREKLRSKYESLKKLFNRLTAEHIDLKQKNKVKESPHKLAKKENSALKHCTTVQKPGTFHPSSTLFLQRSRTQPISQKWVCRRCTFINHPSRNNCDVCDLDRSFHKNKDK